MGGLLQGTSRSCWQPQSLNDCFRTLGVLMLLLLPGIRPARAQAMTVAPDAAHRPMVILQHAVTNNKIQQAVRAGQSMYQSTRRGGTARRPGRVGRQRPAGRPVSQRPAKLRIRRPIARRPASGTQSKVVYAPGRPGSHPVAFLGQLPAFSFAQLPVFRRQPSPVVTRPQPAPVVPRPQPAPVAPAPSASFQPGASPAGGNGAFETQEVSLISQYRQQNGLNALTIDPHFSAIALGHSQDMASRQSMDHNGFDQRFAQAQQYGATRCVENVAWNYNDPQSLFSAWQNSPEHNANMLDSAIRRAGVSIVNGYSTFFACN